MPIYGHNRSSLPFCGFLFVKAFIHFIKRLHIDDPVLVVVVSLMLLDSDMASQKHKPTSEQVGKALQAFLDERYLLVAAQVDQPDHSGRFAWCGDVLDYLVQGLDRALARLGITFHDPYPGPMRLWDEDQDGDGQHVRRFWTTALYRNCPVAKVCTLFFHRHDRLMPPRTPKVLAFPPDHVTDSREVPGQ